MWNREGQTRHAGRTPARQTSTRLEGEAALGVEVAKPAARRRVGADRLGVRPNYGLGGPG